MKIKKGKINFKSKSFIKSLKKIIKTNTQIDKDSKIDYDKMFYKFDI